MEVAIEAAQKFMDNETRINRFYIVGHLCEYRLANFKRYQVIRIGTFKWVKEPDKSYDIREFARWYRHEGKDKNKRNQSFTEQGEGPRKSDTGDAFKDVDRKDISFIDNDTIKNPEGNLEAISPTDKSKS